MRRIRGLPRIQGRIHRRISWESELVACGVPRRDTESRAFKFLESAKIDWRTRQNILLACGNIYDFDVLDVQLCLMFPVHK